MIFITLFTGFNVLQWKQKSPYTDHGGHRAMYFTWIIVGPVRNDSRRIINGTHRRVVLINFGLRSNDNDIGTAYTYYPWVTAGGAKRPNSESPEESFPVIGSTALCRTPPFSPFRSVRISGIAIHTVWTGRTNEPNTRRRPYGNKSARRYSTP